jgi:hypothetical protein
MTVTAELPARPLTLDDVTRLAEADTNHRFELSEGKLTASGVGSTSRQACEPRPTT